MFWEFYITNSLSISTRLTPFNTALKRAIRILSIFAANIRPMKAKWLYIFTLCLLGIFAISHTESGSNKSNGSKFSVASKLHTTTPEKPFNGDSPFIRFHSATNVSGVSISSPTVLVTSLKSDNLIPEKFAGIIEYLSSLDYKLPVTREIFYATPLRSPPIFS
jgi:hypothetical protein